MMLAQHFDKNEFKDFWRLVDQNPRIALTIAPEDAVGLILQVQLAAKIPGNCTPFVLSAQNVARKMQQQFSAPVSLLIDRLDVLQGHPVGEAKPAECVEPTSRDVMRLIAVMIVALCARGASRCGCSRLALWLLERSVRIGRHLPKPWKVELRDA